MQVFPRRVREVFRRKRITEELTDSQLLDWLVSRAKALTVSVGSLSLGAVMVAVIVIAFYRYLEARAEYRDGESRLNACAIIYDGSASNPYIGELMRRHPDCARRAQRDRDRGLIPSRMPAPSKSASATSSGGIPKTAESDSPETPVQSPSAGAVRPPSSAPRTPRASVSASKSPTRTPVRGSSGAPPTPRPSQSGLCISVGLGPLGSVRVLCS